MPHQSVALWKGVVQQLQRLPDGRTADLQRGGELVLARQLS
jgi:hypothetical protein